MLRSTSLTAALACFLLRSSVLAQGPVVRDQSDLDPLAGGNFGSVVAADDFVLAASTRLAAVTIWVGDADGTPENGVVDAFGDAVGWAIYTNGAGLPGTLVASGRSRALVERDTGLGLGVAGLDLSQLRFELEPPPTLAAGTYWLALHEGSWGAGSDGTAPFWVASAGLRGSGAAFAAATANPGAWQGVKLDLAFVLFGDAPLWEQFDDDVTSNQNESISAYAIANDFVLPVASRLGSVDLWLSDNSEIENGALDNFSGVLSWAIYSEASAKPGSLLASGRDAAPLLVDTGENDPFGEDVVRARLRFGGGPLLAAGAYWLAIHEGDWGSPSDQSSIFLQFASSSVRLFQHQASANLLTSWSSSGSVDGAFALFDEIVFASGFEAGGTCGWSASAGGICP